MKRITIIALPTLAVLLPSLGCSSSNRDALIDAARIEFHRRWAAKQFHEIYMNTDGTIRLKEFNVQSNAEVRCSFRVAPWLQLFGENICETTQLGPSPALRPL